MRDGVAVEDARQALQQLCWHTRREPGCLRFELLQQTDDTAGFWLLESFRDPPTPLLPTTPPRIPWLTRRAA